VKLPDPIPVVNFPYKTDQYLYDNLKTNVQKAKEFTEEFDFQKNNQKERL
jgi:hypothetical protein